MNLPESTIVDLILHRYPHTFAIYLFGSHAEGSTHPNSDLDLAILLPHETASDIAPWDWIELTQAIEDCAGIDRVDLINLRQVDTVLQMEVIYRGNRIFCSNKQVADEYEILTTALYQQLELERRELVEDGIRSGRFYHD